MTEQPTPTPDSVYADLWKPLIDGSGQPEFEITKKLLYDYGALLADTGALYDYLTEGQITNPQNPVEEVIELADTLGATAIDLGIQETLGMLLDLIKAQENEPCETQLEVLTKSINALFELGRADVDA